MTTKKRSEEDMMSLILSVAQQDERIRAVILNGSRTNPQIVKDDFQDFDVIYLVDDMKSFQDDLHWIDVFGKRIILQMPDSMTLPGPEVESTADHLTYLMLFKDFNRIDLKLIDVRHHKSCGDSLNQVLLDKDKVFSEMREPNESDYLTRRPTQKVFHDCCNEFWWVSTYVVKGLARDEILYAEDMLEGPVRSMFMLMLAWYAGAEHDFTINVGKSNRFLKKYVSSTMWARILKTYPDADRKHIRSSLMEMTNLFHQLALSVASNTGLNYNSGEADNVKNYLQAMEQTMLE